MSTWKNSKKTFRKNGLCNSAVPDLQEFTSFHGKKKKKKKTVKWQTAQQPLDGHSKPAPGHREPGTLTLASCSGVTPCTTSCPVFALSTHYPSDSARRSHPRSFPKPSGGNAPLLGAPTATSASSTRGPSAACTALVCSLAGLLPNDGVRAPRRQTRCDLCAGTTRGLQNAHGVSSMGTPGTNVVYSTPLHTRPQCLSSVVLNRCWMDVYPPST